MTAPLVPSDVDLRDFSFTPVEFARLLSSDTWLQSNDAEKVAALTLWGRSWTQIPAGSLPDDDKSLAGLSGAGAKWKRVKTMALRGWIKCDDGRLYHPVMCVKALEAWIEKLSARLSSGAGNAKRWGLEFDPTPIESMIQHAVEMLTGLDPDSRKISRKRPARTRDDIPPGVPNESHRESRWDRNRQGQRDISLTDRSGESTRDARRAHEDHEGQFEGHESPGTAPPNPVAPLAIALNRAGHRCTSMNPALIAYHAAGGTVAHLLEVAAHPECAGKPAAYIANFAKRELTEPAKTIATTPATHAARSQPSKTMQGLAALEAMKHDPLVPERNSDRTAEAVHALPGPHTGR